MPHPIRLALSCALALACAGAPAPPAPDRSALWGHVRLVPREGVSPGGVAGAASPYGDRRYADVPLVDYTRPGFAVVYLEGTPPAGVPPTRLAVHAGVGGLRLEPRHAAIPAGGRILLENRSDEPHVVTCPRLGLVWNLAGGASAEIRVPGPGSFELFVPGADAAVARVFAAPGPYSVADGAGRYELVDLEPGAHVLHAWHPRFPPAARLVELAPGQTARVDLELGVGLAGEGEGDAR